MEGRAVSVIGIGEILPNKWLKRTPPSVTPPARREAQASCHPSAPPLSHTVGRSDGGIDVRAVEAAVLLLCCLFTSAALADDVPLAVGLGGGLDISGWSGKGVFDFGSVLAGYVAWMGSYPRVYRLSAQWTRLHREVWEFCNNPALVAGESDCDDIEIVNLTAIQAGVMWFARHSGRVARYAGASAGLFRIRSEDAWKPTHWRFVVSPSLGVSFKPGGLPVSVESGFEMVIGEDPAFVIIPLRMYVRL
jgi:hypothetical protein